jgi:hypothetical protein
MKIRLLKQYGIKPAGSILNSVSPARAQILIQSRIAEPVEDKPKKKKGVKQ